jgi:GrpB-like predicted nucleotidyltransferase (UPF0157 family)
VPENPFVMVPYSAQWTADFRRIATAIRSALGPAALRIDHIGSTSVPGLCSKDVVDIQVTVADLKDVHMLESFAAAGFILRDNPVFDHVPPGYPEVPGEWEKRYLREPPGERASHIHVRVAGKANQRYALLFRDYLRAHPPAAAAYGLVKERMARAMERSDYVDAKDPVCDLIIQSAEVWARGGWNPGPSDA